LIPRLADQYRVIAPDFLGFGFAEVPQRREYRYSFDALAHTILAPLVVSPRRVRSASPLISQNGNAYEEALGAWAPIKRYWSEPSAENRETLGKTLTRGIGREYILWASC
jgi:hypothetical protein